MYLYYDQRRVFAAITVVGAFSQNVSCFATTTTAPVATNPFAPTTSALPTPPPAAPDIHSLEVEVIFPRNETYKASDVMMTWTVDFGNKDRGERCGMETVLHGNIMFPIKSQYELTHGQPPWQEYIEAVDATVPTDNCPIQSMVYDIQQNTTTPELECFMIRNQIVIDIQGDPCAAGIDQAVASSIQNEASSLATSAWCSKSSEPTSSSTSNFATLRAAPADSTLVAVLFVVCLTFGL